MKAFWRAFWAESLKNKRTLSLWLAFLAPVALAFLELVVGYQYGQRMYRPGGDAWQTLLQHVMVMWNLLILPLFVTLQMGLLGALEHNNKTWKQLYALPTPRWTIYAAKQLSGVLVIGLSMVNMAVLTVATGLLIHLVDPGLGFNANIPWKDILAGFWLSFLAAGLIISIHLWISLRWSSFVLAMGVGIVATVTGVLVVSSDLANYYPWTLSGMVSFHLTDQEPVVIPLVIGLLGGLVVAGLGCWDVSRRDVL